MRCSPRLSCLCSQTFSTKKKQTDMHRLFYCHKPVTPQGSLEDSMEMMVARRGQKCSAHLSLGIAPAPPRSMTRLRVNCSCGVVALEQQLSPHRSTALSGLRHSKQTAIEPVVLSSQPPECGFGSIRGERCGLCQICVCHCYSESTTHVDSV